MNIQEAKQVLRDNGYFVDNLWRIEDVQDRFKCDDETAHDILNGALTNEYIVEMIFSDIRNQCEEEGFEEVED